MSEHDPPPELDSRPQSRREWSGYMRSLVLPLGLVVAIVAGLLLYQSVRDGGSAAEDGYGTVALPAEKNPTTREPAAEQGRAAPDFLLRDIAGDEVRLSDLQGRPVLVNFWATWCTTCRIEMPALIAAYNKHGAEGLVVLGVNLRESEARAAPFVKDFGMTFPVLMDRSGEVARTWRIGGPNEGVPSSYFIDSEGVVQKVVFGLLSEKTLGESLALILAPRG
ncbi:MAG: redoxin domain-containing protein [Dehalococcoidia bacterium]|nr:redoxin domain-containing protein [Dehalococcoidia bacterium]